MTLIKTLILEDNPDDAELLVLELEEAGYEVDWQRVYSEHDFLMHLSPDLDIILADFTLPQFNAFAALKLLHEKDYNVPFIVVTGTISEETAVACMKQGAADYLLKDRLPRLGEAVRQAMLQHDLRREQRMAEQELRVMNQAVNSSSNAFFLADFDGIITFVNGALIKLWGYEDEHDIVGNSLTDLWPANLHGAAILEQTLRNKSVSGEMPSFRQDQTPFVLQYSLSTILDTDDSPLCIMGVFLDITQQKLAERAQREAETLQIALEQQNELQELKSRFLSMVVHDFRNPLAVIQLKLEGLRKYSDDLTKQQRSARIDKSLDEINQLNELMEDVLTISRFDLDTSLFNPSENDIVEFCRDVIDTFKEAANDEHSLVIEGLTTSLPILFDPSLMRRIILNLLANAVKYSPSNSTVHFNLSIVNDTLVIKISDEGIGIPDSEIDHIFDTFHRASNALKSEGTGLGLAIVKYAVELHGGSVSVESSLDRGTTFTVTIPMS